MYDRSDRYFVWNPMHYIIKIIILNGKRKRIKIAEYKEYDMVTLCLID